MADAEVGAPGLAGVEVDGEVAVLDVEHDCRELALVGDVGGVARLEARDVVGARAGHARLGFQRVDAVVAHRLGELEAGGREAALAHEDACELDRGEVLSPADLADAPHDGVGVGGARGGDLDVLVEGDRVGDAVGRGRGQGRYGERSARVGRVGEGDQEFVAVPVVAADEVHGVDVASIGVFLLHLQHEGEGDVLCLGRVHGGGVGARGDDGVDCDWGVVEALGEVEDTLRGEGELAHLRVEVGGHRTGRAWCLSCCGGGV